jgi:hypothetical protein
MFFKVTAGMALMHIGVPSMSRKVFLMESFGPVYVLSTGVAVVDLLFLRD